MGKHRIYWTESNPPAYRKGNNDNHLAIIMQNPVSQFGDFADCDSGCVVEHILQILHNHDKIRFKDFEWECAHLINAWPCIDLPTGNWQNQIDTVRLSVQKHKQEFLYKIEGKDLILFGEFAEAAYVEVRGRFHGNGIIKLWHPSEMRTRKIKVFKNYFNSRKAFQSLSDFQVCGDVTVRNGLLAQLYADYIYMRWLGRYGYSFTFKNFLNKLYENEDQ